MNIPFDQLSVELVCIPVINVPHIIWSSPVLSPCPSRRRGHTDTIEITFRNVNDHKQKNTLISNKFILNSSS